jgi:hypothetical protein
MAERIKYQFPARLVQHFLQDDEKISSSQLTKIKKRILLEIQLSANQIIEVNGSVYTKNDILHLFESLGNSTDLNYHLIVERTPFLRNILASTSSDELKKESIALAFETESEESDFIEFVSPYLAFAINRISAQLIKEQHYDHFIYLLSSRKWIKNDDFGYAYKKLISHYEEFIQFSRDIERRKITKIRARNLGFLKNPSYFRAAGLLDEYVPELPDDLANAVTQIAILFDNTPRRNRLFYEALRNLIKIIEDPEWRSITHQNIIYFGSRLGISSGFSIRFKRIFIGSLIGLFIVIGILTRDAEAKKSASQIIAEWRVEQFDLEEYSAYILDSNLRPQPDSIEIWKIHNYVCDTAALTPKIRTYSNRRLPRDFSYLLGKRTIVNLTNETSRLALFILKGKSGIQSVYVPPDHYSPFVAKGPTEVLVYTGQQWDFQRPWSYCYTLPSTTDTTTVYMTGAMTYSNKKDQELLTKTYRILPVFKSYVLKENSDSLWLTH